MAVTSRWFRRSCALAVLAVSLGACGDDDTETAATGDEPASSVTAPETSSPDTTDAAGASPLDPTDLEFRPVLQLLPPGGSGDGCATPEDDWAAEQPVLAPQLEDGQEVACFELGPGEADGAVVESAAAQEDGLGNWMISLVLTSDGIATFNESTRACFDGAPTCPTRQLAILVDRAVISAPSINAPEFERDQISISGGFTQDEAEALAAGLG
ncbi:hypothetical protein NHL50_02190 [Acidimicrobiia bacterium EGI L10123]|uniref:SecDF P1 head subdomain-containing protein n=1 Tax=Salinilacustrithrix flava TaxID=2957203 RepID=UPI003D7C1D60|nr:hypothetical protein [Acidimicrobiia bacterium EGI L10123]